MTTSAKATHLQNLRSRQLAQQERVDELNDICGGELAIRNKGYGPYATLRNAQIARDEAEDYLREINRQILAAGGSIPRWEVQVTNHDGSGTAWHGPFWSRRQAEAYCRTWLARRGQTATLTIDRAEQS